MERDEQQPGILTRSALWAGPVLAALVGLGTVHGLGLSAAAGWTAAVTTLCAVWWVFEPIPLAASSLIPFAVFPMVRVLDYKQVAACYGHHLVLLMLAGSIASTAMERSGAHHRLAVGMVRLVGGGEGRRLVLGFLVASATLSMWMSNTATTLMLLPVALAVIAGARSGALALPLLLAVPYGASIGGSGTPIGTPPNLIFLEQYREAAGDLTFLGWMSYSLPVVVVMVPVAWRWLVRNLPATEDIELPAPRPWRAEERRVLLIFGLMALAWVTRAEPLGGWSALLGVEGYAGDSTVALVAVVVLFVVPRGTGDGDRLMDWETATRIPWGVFIMIGGGICVGEAFGASKLDAELGRALGFLTEWSPWVVMPLLCLVATFTTEVTSNTAVANILMPVLAATAVAGDVDPIVLMLPAALGINHAFMLPVATAPNAIIYGTGRVTLRQMASEGLALNLLGVVVIATICLLRA